MIENFQPEVFTRVYLALFFSAVAGFYTIRIILKKRHDHVEIVFPGEKRSTTWYAHMTFRFFRVAIWLVCLVRWPFPAVDAYLLVFSVPGWVIFSGVILLTAGFTLTLVGHFSLGKDWRSGIDPSGPHHLVTSHIFSLSRNPMYVGVKMAQIGFFLALPSVFSLLCLVVGWIAVDSQLREEEKYLEVRFPGEWEVYRRSVRRWL